MERAVALHALEQSLSEGSSTPCTWREDRDVYIEEESAKLRASVIDPIKVTVRDSEFVSEVSSELQGRDLFAIARSGHNWLILEPAGSVFALAFGESSDKLTFCGFYSSDALAEWLG